MLSNAGDFHLVDYRHNIAESLEALRGVHPDIVLVDQGHGTKAVLQFIADMRSVSPRVHPVIWVQELAEVESFRALQMGARGLVRKTLPVTTLLECLRTVATGTVWVESTRTPEAPADGASGLRRGMPRLTPREREIVIQVCRGLKNKEIADMLSITPGTVKVHLMHIFEKTGVQDRFELAVHGRRLVEGA